MDSIGLIGILRLVGGIISTLMVAVPLFLLLFISSFGASFGKDSCSRGVSRLGFAVMLALLSGEWVVFQFFCGERSAASSFIAAVLLAMIAWSFVKTAFTDPGSHASSRWEAWEACAKPVQPADEVETAVSAVKDAQERKSQVAKLKQAAMSSGGCSGYSCVALFYNLIVASWRFFGCAALTEGSSEPRSINAPTSKSNHRDWEPAGKSSYCEKCDRMRPARAHHCKVCKMCVMHMDHHCPLVGNCIGACNLKYFVVLQWWQFWGCLFFLFHPTGAVAAAREATLSGHNPLDLVFTSHRLLALYTSVGWAGFVTFVSFRALTVTVYDAAHNQTTIESNYVGNNPYRLAKCTDNLKQAFGALDFWLFFPVEPQQADVSSDALHEHALLARLYGT